MCRLTVLSFSYGFFLLFSIHDDGRQNFCLDLLLFQNIVDSLCSGCGTNIIPGAACSNIASREV